MQFGRLTPPPAGSVITFANGTLSVPDDPVIPFIAGDGIGVDITPAMQAVVDAAVAKAFGGTKRIAWYQVPAGEASFQQYGEWLPAETLDAIRHFRVAIKGPMTTPVGGGIRSLNVALRQELSLYACVRPVRWFEGVPAPVKRPQDLDVVIFRENMEDIYMGLEFPAGSPEAADVIEAVHRHSKKRIPEGSGIGIKPISKKGTERITEAAFQFARAKGRSSITIVHKGNIQKFTEGAFRDWAYAWLLANHRDAVVTEDELSKGASVDGRLVVKDRIADAMFQQLLLRPDEYDVIVSPNLNGDYLSDACAAQVGGLGMAPGANLGDGYGVFEATHGTAPKYAGQDKVNPGSLVLSACMMLETLGWDAAATLIYDALSKAISDGHVTYDLARQMQGATELSCSGFAQALIARL
jgi:isocitrate dehydrogenase